MSTVVSVPLPPCKARLMGQGHLAMPGSTRAVLTKRSRHVSGSEGLLDTSRRKELEEVWLPLPFAKIQVWFWMWGSFYLFCSLWPLQKELWVKYLGFVLCQRSLMFDFHSWCIIRHIFISSGLVYCNDCILNHLENESTAEGWYTELTLIAAKQTVSI